ncbi:oxygen-independent coproporphyrinogen III oxidase [Marinobacterium sedimentorum]|uniref:oxygen-independent coproporphyrinogen III oxidase n=1 Tax=Marinobacterium sedimentorum TaxID=2927804 RepID=UPI0020C6121D|nr:oxygen-independent coproporphyrinogen III oxidase [Marinobacterium sedimentorum]MCP8687262.1 oxygen-independent coproporphyrinogen III oxidase [Marinobacterium sedimentorum]
MQNEIAWDNELIRRYDLSGPRYTSYPTALQFSEKFGPQDYSREALNSNAAGKPLSLYFHIPFCASLCYYCGCNKIITQDRAKAQAYLNSLQEEIRLQAELLDTDQRTVQQLHWGGGTPTFISPQQMYELMETTGRHFKLLDDDSGDYSIEIDPREADHKTLETLRAIGFNRISLGVQDFNPAVQRAVNRVQSPELTADVLAKVRELGFRSTNIDLIYGLPLQTVDTFAQTLDQVIAMNPDRLSVFNYAHLPERLKSQRLIQEQDLPSPAEKLKILEITIAYLIGAGYVYIGMDHFAKPNDPLAQAQQAGVMHRNFQGYSTHADCDLVAMGVSSISQVGDTYCQNAHKINDYQDAIQGGQLAVTKGLQLGRDDLIRRAVINQLICHFKLDGNAFSAQHGINFADYFARELAQLQQHQRDGLVQIDRNQLQVTPRGRLLIRSICMNFDHYINQDTLRQSYSRII